MQEKEDIMLRMKDLRIILGKCCRQTIYDKINHGLLPRPVRLGQRMVLWPKSEISAVLAAHLAGHGDDVVRALVCRLHEDRQGR